jgi:UDP-N-acetylglucosamine--N-acetylmuramyl-(pentapeptide) pyrophosphoryl-undecaprenol N-acetylglucosamine transferase
MKVLLTGGGTGGHITPLLAVAHKLKQQQPDTEVIYVGDRGGKFTSMTAGQTVFDQQYDVRAGKLRRYHGESWLHRLFDFKTNLLNLRDIFYVLIGVFQSYFLLKKLKPDVILLKGGFVGVPVGLAGAARKIPLVTHDSDAIPGLANRLAGCWAVYHATALPAEHYGYPAAKSRFTGVLVGDSYKPVTAELQADYRQQLKVPADDLLLLITGGSLGSQKLNDGLVSIAPRLLQKYPKLWIFHVTGRGNQACYGDFSNPQLKVSELLSDLYIYSGAADVVVTRAGANSLAEFGVQGKASIVVPNPLLTGGHQLENAQHLLDQQAVKVVDETSLAKDSGQALLPIIEELLDNPQQRSQLGSKLQSLTIKDAAQNLAKLLLEVGSRAGE